MTPERTYTTINGDKISANVKAVNHVGLFWSDIYYWSNGEWVSSRVETTADIFEIQRNQRKYFFRERVENSTEIHTGIRVSNGVMDLSTGKFLPIPKKWLSASFKECAHEGNITDQTWRDDYLLVNFTYRMRRLLKTFHLTQVKLAEMVFVKPSQVCEWVNGKSLPSFEMLRAIALALKISADYLLGLEENIRRVDRI